MQGYNPSRGALYLNVLGNENGTEVRYAQATGFVIRHEGMRYLVSNWHVMAGRNAETGKPLHSSAATPTALDVWCHSKVPGVSAARVRLGLYDPEDGPLWLEHRDSGSQYDVAALPIDVGQAFTEVLAGAASVEAFNLDEDDAHGWTVRNLLVTERVSIVGFPLGRTAGSIWPIWAQGHVASEPRIPFQHLPVILIDARTNQGQSGSPVIYRQWTPSGYDSTPTGESDFATATNTRLVGVYSGRLVGTGEGGQQVLDVGRVWTADAIRTVLTSPTAHIY
jgi:hypothetical protein